MSRLRLTLACAAAAGFACVAVPAGFSRVEAHDLPPSAAARPGECYGKVILPPVYGRAERQELVRPAWTETRPGAAVYEKQGRRVLVRPERVLRYRTPALYREEVSWIVRPGARRWVTRPPEYGFVREKVLLEPAHAEWRRTDAPLAYGEALPGQTRVQPTGEVVCRVWVPARYGHVERKVLISPARSYLAPGRARRERIVRHVLVRAAGWAERREPAVYRTEWTRRLVRQGRAEIIRHPAVYRSVGAPALVSAEREGWARVVCGGPINPAFMAQVQQALIARGFDPGPPDGVARPQTYAALRQFQRQNGLAVGQLTQESAHALGVL